MTIYQVMVYLTPEEEFMEGRQVLAPDKARSLMERRKMRNELLMRGL